MNLLARKLAHLLVENSDDTFFEDEIRYGLEIVLGALLQIVLIALVAMLLGIVKEVLVIVCTAALYRRSTGGPHCKTYVRCTVTSLLIFITLAFIIKFIPVNYLPIYITCLAIFSVLVIHLYVPVDNPINIISDESIIRKLKRQSYLVLLLFLLITITSYVLSQEMIIITILIGLLWQNFTLLPWGQAFIRSLDLLFERIEGLLKRKEVMKC